MGGRRHAPAALPPGNNRYPLYRRLGGPQGRSGRVRKTEKGRARAEPDGTRAETTFIFRLNGRVHLNRWGSQFSRLLAAEVCASALVMMDTPRCEVV